LTKNNIIDGQNVLNLPGMPITTILTGIFRSSGALNHYPMKFSTNSTPSLLLAGTLSLL
jgi:hypothetical protein